jgi:uncharacterized protein
MHSPDSHKSRPVPRRQLLRPSAVARRLVEVDPAALAAQGIKGVIVDLDNTLTEWRSTAVSPALEQWLGHLRAAGLAACIVSNAGTAKRVRRVADRLGLPWVTRAVKPLARGFHRAMHLMQTEPATTAVVGDQLFTDILGGNRLHLHTILVDPLGPREGFTTRLQRPFERMVKRKW